MNKIYLKKARELVEISINFFEEKNAGTFPYRNSFYLLFFENKEFNTQFIEIFPMELMDECINYIKFISSISYSINDSMYANHIPIKNTDLKNFLYKLKNILEKAYEKDVNYPIDETSSSNSENPKVFISYSWDDEEHKTWVANLVGQLRSDGIDVILDQYDLILGDRLPQFMERSIAGSDYVLIVCTPKYKNKSDFRKDGTGYEGNIISGELMSNGNERKFIPIIRKGTKQTALPTFLSEKVFADFTKEDDFKRSHKYKMLLETLYKMQVKPKLGKKPPFLEQVKTPVETTILSSTTDTDSLIFDVKKYSQTIDYISPIDSDILKFFEEKYYSSNDDVRVLTTLWRGTMIEEDKTGVLFFNILLSFVSKHTEYSEEYFSEHSDDLFKQINMDSKTEKDYWDKNGINKFIRAVLFFFHHPNLYNTLGAANKLAFKIKCKENLNNFLVAYYCDSDLSTHFEECEVLLNKNERNDENKYWGDYSKFDIDAVILVHELAKKRYELDQYNKFVIKNVFDRAHDYRRCEAVLKEILPVFLPAFTKEDIMNTLDIFDRGQYVGLGSSSDYGKHHYDTWHYLKEHVPTIRNSVKKDELLHIDLNLAKKIWECMD